MKAELRGDAVHIELRDESDGPTRAALTAVPGVRDGTLDGRNLSARADDGAATVPHALAALDRAGTPAATPAAALLALAVLTVWLSTRTVRTYQKSV